MYKGTIMAIKQLLCATSVLWAVANVGAMEKHDPCADVYRKINKCAEFKKTKYPTDIKHLTDIKYPIYKQKNDVGAVEKHDPCADVYRKINKCAEFKKTKYQPDIQQRLEEELKEYQEFDEKH